MVIVSHFYNEEYLLPWWLEHHKKIFDHGILINHQSTDKSVDIIKKICPTWEIRETKLSEWYTADDDRELMEAERDCEGYKMILPTTEFLIRTNPGELNQDPRCYAIPMFILVDNDPDNRPVYNKPLIEQKTNGYWSTKNRFRFLHNHKDGTYTGLGIHHTKHKIVRTNKFIILKAAFSPWTPELIKRKLNTKARAGGTHGKHHYWDRERLKPKN